MKRYYIIDDADWPHGWPDVDGNLPDIPFSAAREPDGTTADPRLRLQGAVTIDLGSIDGPQGKHLAVLLHTNGRPPESWDDKQLPHLLSGDPLSDDQVAALACLGVVKGDRTYEVGKKASANTPHYHPHWEPA